MRWLVFLVLFCAPLQGIVIKVDYRYDTQGFFNDPAAKVAIEAAAARWSRIIDQTLLPVNLEDRVFLQGNLLNGDERFWITHPGTGQRNFAVSVAASAATDFYINPLGAPAANDYLNGFTLENDEWVLFVGGTVLDVAAQGAPVNGNGNLTQLYPDTNFFVNRGFNTGRDSLAVFGGVVSFDLDREWNFDLSQPGSPTALDFYSVAIHEIGHGLGLNARSVAEWAGMLVGNEFVGPNVIAAYLADTGISLSGLEIVSPSPKDYHWKDDEYDSRIFPFGTPLYLGTVGAGGLQDLLMEPSFSVGAFGRLEVTNVDAAALKDLGWSIISADPVRAPDLPLAVGAASGGGLALEFVSEVGATYTIQTSPDGLSWVNVLPSLEGTGGPLSWSDGQEGSDDPFGPSLALKSKFYRVLKD